MLFNVQSSIKDLIAAGAADCFLEVLLCYLASVLAVQINPYN